MKATLEVMIKPSSIRLTLPADLKEPRTNTIDCPADDSFFLYHSKIAVRTNRPVTGTVTANIFTLVGTGRGQARLFDRLCGEGVARSRRELSHQLRLLNLDSTYVQEQEMQVDLTQADIDRMRALIMGHAEDVEPKFGPLRYPVQEQEMQVNLTQADIDGMRARFMDHAEDAEPKFGPLYYPVPE